MMTINGTVEYRGREYNYTVDVKSHDKKNAAPHLKNIVAADGQSLPDNVDTLAFLNEFARENAHLLFWCRQAGWEICNTPHPNAALVCAKNGLIQKITHTGAPNAPTTIYESITLGLYNWAGQLISEEQTFIGGIAEWISSGGWKPPQPLPDPKPVLKKGVLYSSDNGMIVCVECAGQSALFTGYDISGQKVIAIPRSENALWRLWFGKDMSCERGCTSYGEQNEDNLPKVPDKLRHPRQRNPKTR